MTMSEVQDTDLGPIPAERYRRKDDDADIVTMSEVQDTDLGPIPAERYRRKDDDVDDIDDIDDPGLIFVVWPASMVHLALALPAVAHLHPPLQQGKKNYD